MNNISIDMLVRAALYAQRQWHSADDAVAAAHGMAIFLDSRGVRLELDGEQFAPSISLKEWRRMIERRDLLAEFEPPVATPGKRPVRIMGMNIQKNLGDLRVGDIIQPTKNGAWQRIVKIDDHQAMTRYARTEQVSTGKRHFLALYDSTVQYAAKPLARDIRPKWDIIHNRQRVTVTSAHRRANGEIEVGIWRPAGSTLVSGFLIEEDEPINLVKLPL
jgi:hypothetical protein